METEVISASDEVESSNEEYLIPTAPFTPPALADSQYKQLELLQHLSLYSELVIFLSGEHGMGKSFIAQALLASREAPDQSLMLEADFSLSYFDILHKLAEFLDLEEPSSDLQAFENQVLSHCLQIAEEDQGSMLLIIDQADQLADETLEDLNNLAMLAPNALHLMLVATTDFEDKLVSLSEPQAPLHVMEVEPLENDEAEILLLQSFPDKDWQGEEVEYILQQGSGNPGKILYIAQQLIAGKAPAGQGSSATARFPITHIAAMLLIACALLMSYFYQSTSNIDKSKLVSDDGLVIEKAAITAALSTGVELGTQLEDYSLAQNQVEEVGQDKEVDFNFVESEGVHSLALAKNSDKQQGEAKNITEPTALEGVVDPIVEDEPVKQKPGAIKDQVTEPVDSKVDTLVKNTSIANNKRSQDTETFFTADEEKLLNAEPSSYVIQLFGSHNKKSAILFAKTYSSKQTQLSQYQTQHKGKPWHVVIAGPYQSRAAATGQLKYFPEKIRRQNPWVRSTPSIQQLIKAAK